MSNKEKLIIIKNRSESLGNLLTQDYKSYEPIALKLLEKDLIKDLKCIPSKVFETIFKLKLQNSKLEENLIDYIKKYKATDKISSNFRRKLIFCFTVQKIQKS